MILFTILCLIGLTVLVGLVVTLLTAGVTTLAVFGDLIVCVILIGLLVKFLFFRNKGAK